MSNDRCALRSLRDEPLAGTGPEAPLWLLVEDPGPWGRDALADGTLPRDVRAHLADQVAIHGLRHQAIRRHDRAVGDSRRVMVANLVSGWMAGTTLPLAALGHVDLGAAAHATPPRDWDRVTDPVVLACTHGRRDACCAQWGRPVAAALAAVAPVATWETSHTGGHRFAASVVVLPSGSVHGRVDDPAGLWAAISRDEIDLSTYRGHAGWPRPVQAAEVAVRRRDGLVAPGALALVALRAGPDEDARTVRLATPRGELDVLVRAAALPPRPVSCGADPSAPTTWTVEGMGPA